MPHMIENLTLTDFRNHACSRITTHGRPNIIITGPNGAGKTAILEAISMLGGDRGMRGAPYTDVARFGASGGFAVHARLRDDSDVAVTFAAGDANRHAHIDGDTAGLADLAARLRVVWITPREDRIFVDSAADRRAFFDRLVAGFDATHPGRVARLGKLISERAFALRRGADGHWLDALDIQIASIAVAVAAARIRYGAELNYFLEHIAVSVTGFIEEKIISDTASAAEKLYLDYLRTNRCLTGDKMVIDGPHKSDFGVFNASLGLPANLTSTGQQKRALLDLILAHAKLIHTKTGANPIILLDEAAAHLDSDARRHLFQTLGTSHAQVWATGLDPAAFSDIPNAAFVTCMNGDIHNILIPVE